ncbi:MAG: DUF4177 domain-containing protein [Acidimicrobiales bacterium]|nr:DUF4177 domain-containing protein [Hyphomonadaceae bacterium]RZV44381.1 MAG: DUF4177 domain-containing protein [Acidimicrobiales bacterium]
MYDHKWRYKVETVKIGRVKDFETRDELIQEKLNRYGSEGWEVFQYEPAGTYIHVVMKRKH